MATVQTCPVTKHRRVCYDDWYDSGNTHLPADDGDLSAEAAPHDARGSRHGSISCGVMAQGGPTCRQQIGNTFLMLRFEVFTAVTMKNAVSWDVVPCWSYVNRRFGGTITWDVAPYRSCVNRRFGGTIKWDVVPCRSCANRRFGGTIFILMLLFAVRCLATTAVQYPLSSLFITHVAHFPSLPVLIQLGVFDWWLSLQPSAHAGSLIANFSTLKMETKHSSETSVHTRSTRRHIPEDDILHISCALLHNAAQRLMVKRSMND
jgi:hypothetical protein